MAFQLPVRSNPVDCGQDFVKCMYDSATQTVIQFGFEKIWSNPIWTINSKSVTNNLIFYSIILVSPIVLLSFSFLVGPTIFGIIYYVGVITALFAASLVFVPFLDNNSIGTDWYNVVDGYNSSSYGSYTSSSY